MGKIPGPGTPLPWSVGSDPGSNYDIAWLVDANGNSLIDRDCCFRKAVAGRIVRAVNTHAELLAACRAALRAIDHATSGTMYGAEDEVEQIKAAIVAAEAATPAMPANSA